MKHQIKFALGLICFWLFLSIPESQCEAQIVKGMQQHRAWASFILESPGQGSWVRITTNGSGTALAFDFGQGNTVVLLGLPLVAPPIQAFIAVNGMPPPNTPVIMRGEMRIDLNPVIPIGYTTIFENGMAWMYLQGPMVNTLQECIRGKTLRLKIDVGTMAYFYNFSLSGFTSAIKRAANLYRSLFGNILPDSSYFIP